MSTNKEDNGRAQAEAQYESVCYMVAGLEREAREDAEERIREDALSVEIRNDWHIPGGSGDSTPTDFKILLCTGGPAVQIRGELDEHGEPCRAWLEYQDWGTPWTRLFTDRVGESVDEDTLLAYARCFYFGEG